MQTSGGAARRARGGHAPTAEWVAAVQKKMPEGECAPHAARESAERGGVCFTDSGVRALARATGQEPADPAAVVARAKAATGCGTQACLLVKALGSAPGEQARLKPAGPAHTRKWLDNNNIDQSCQQWEAQFPGYRAVPYAMMNFMSYNSALRSFDPAAALRAGARAFSCVLNTDHYPGPGKHWVCVFADLRGAEGTVEYFNSSGRPPPDQCVEWMVNARNALTSAGKKTTDVVVARRPHQQGDSECGVYCLFYIWSRLNGVPWEQFAQHQVPDQAVFQFRERLFNTAD